MRISFHTRLLASPTQPGNTLFGCLVSELVEGSAGGLPDAAADLIKALLDPETMDTVGETNPLTWGRRAACEPDWDVGFRSRHPCTNGL